MRCSQVACGGAHNLALVHQPRGGNGTGAALYVWGSDIFGECGLVVPEEVGRGLDVSAIDVDSGQQSGRTAAGATPDGPADRQYATGRQRGAVKFFLVPTRNSGVAASSITDMQCGSAHSLILCLSGLVVSFGRGEYGQQGNGKFDHVRRPTAVPFFDLTQPLPRPSDCQSEETPAQRLQRLRGAARVKPRSMYGGYGLPLADGVRQPLPAEGGQQEGVPQAEEASDEERPVVRAIAAGGEHCFAIDMLGGCWAWGWNSFGQLGPIVSAAEEKVAKPQRVNLAQAVVQMSGGHVHSAALCQDGTVLTFGLDRLPHGGGGRLGLGRYVSPSLEGTASACPRASRASIRVTIMRFHLFFPPHGALLVPMLWHVEKRVPRTEPRGAGVTGLRDESIAPTRLDAIPSDYRCVAVACGSGVSRSFISVPERLICFWCWSLCGLARSR